MRCASTASMMLLSLLRGRLVLNAPNSSVMRRNRLRITSPGET
jgi:hypothetical protein